MNPVSLGVRRSWAASPGTALAGRSAASRFTPVSVGRPGFVVGDVTTSPVEQQNAGLVVTPNLYPGVGVTTVTASPSRGRSRFRFLIRRGSARTSLRGRPSSRNGGSASTPRTP